ncbi:MAG: methyltransferase family protein [Promethearchaeota archaeon]
MKNYLKKFNASVFLITFLNLGFLIFVKDVYSKVSNLIILITFNAILCLDINIRPISSEKDQFKYPKRSILLFLLLPLIVILPYFENLLFIQKILRIWDNIFKYLSGIILLIIDGLILIYSRLLLGKFGGSKITIGENHRIIIEGIYKYVRHTVYLGMILVFFGYALSFRTFVTPCAFFFSFFILFKNCMDLEEKILMERFGKEYELYMEKAKRLIHLFIKTDFNFSKDITISEANTFRLLRKSLFNQIQMLCAMTCPNKINAF